MADPNGPLIYDMMVNRSSRWRAQNLRTSILPPGWKMGISRLGRIPVYDPLYGPNSPQSVLEHPEPTAVIRKHGVPASVPPRYQATHPQFNFATDDTNLGSPPHLVQLYHDKTRHDGGGVAITDGRPSFIPTTMNDRRRVPIVVDYLLDDDALGYGLVEPRIDTPQRSSIRKGVPIPRDENSHWSGHGLHRRHRPGYGPNQEVLCPEHVERDIRISKHAHQMDRLNAELERKVDPEAAAIAQREQDLEIADQRRREEHVRLHQGRLARHEEHARMEEEEFTRRHTEEELVRREEELQATEAELVAQEIRHREHHERHEHRHGHGHEHGHRDTRRIVRDPNGYTVIVDNHLPQHHELIRVPAHDLHHSHHGHHHHHSPHRQHASVARAAVQEKHVHFADALSLSEEESIDQNRERLQQEADPLPRRRKFDRERSPYHFLEDDLRKLARHEFHGSGEEYCLHHHERLLMPLQHRKGRGDWWEDAEREGENDE